MKDNYDFSKGVKNPYVGKLKDGYTVTVHYKFTESDDDKGQDEEKKETDDNHSRKHA